MYYAERTETFCIRSKQREALKAEKKELAAEIRKAELSELLDAIEESNLSVNDVHEFIKQNSEQK